MASIPDPTGATRQIRLVGGPFDGETLAEGAVPQNLLCVVLPDDPGTVARYRRTRDPLVREFHDTEVIMRMPGVSS